MEELTSFTFTCILTSYINWEIAALQWLTPEYGPRFTVYSLLPPWSHPLLCFSSRWNCSCERQISLDLWHDAVHLFYEMFSWNAFDYFVKSHRYMEILIYVLQQTGFFRMEPMIKFRVLSIGTSVWSNVCWKVKRAKGDPRKTKVLNCLDKKLEDLCTRKPQVQERLAATKLARSNFYSPLDDYSNFAREQLYRSLLFYVDGKARIAEDNPAQLSSFSIYFPPPPDSWTTAPGGALNVRTTRVVQSSELLSLSERERQTSNPAVLLYISNEQKSLGTEINGTNDALLVSAANEHKWLQIELNYAREVRPDDTSPL